MRFCVSVPVLSEQMVLTEPSVSTAGRRRISALKSAMRRAPMASSTVTTAGSASGMAATARLMAVINMVKGFSPRSRPRPKMPAQTTSTTRDSCLLKVARRCCKGVLRSSASFIRLATLPSSVPMPVATTTPCARPLVTVVSLYAMLMRSPSARSLPCRVAVFFSTVTDSPVRADSSTLSCAASSRRRSAGTWLPASSSTMSPGTNSLAAMGWGLPSRSTCVRDAASWRRAAMAWSARLAWVKPMAALSTTMAMMTSVSVTSPRMPDTTAAASRMMIMKSLN